MFQMKLGVRLHLPRILFCMVRVLGSVAGSDDVHKERWRSDGDVETPDTPGHSSTVFALCSDDQNSSSIVAYLLI